jgi:endonuclease/exonuclease/phosphatase (EEP) superfamily protein YafD
VLRAQRGFVFDAADMTANALRELGIRGSDTDHSDHLPLVVDFRVR